MSHSYVHFSLLATDKLCSAMVVLTNVCAFLNLKGNQPYVCCPLLVACVPMFYGRYHDLAYLQFRGLIKYEFLIISLNLLIVNTGKRLVFIIGYSLGNQDDMKCALA